MDLLEPFDPAVIPQLDANMYDPSMRDAQTRLLSVTTFGPRRESVGRKGVAFRSPCAKIRRMKPLQEWICDTCGRVIANPKDGYVAWNNEKNANGRVQALDFRIFHKSKCDPRYLPCSLALEDFLGPDGLITALGLVDPGWLINQGGPTEPGVKDFHSWAELVRRTQVPHYESARRFFKTADSDGHFEGASETSPYREKSLLEVIEEYEED
ncbi:MAG: hypothetical protein U0183_08600 [Polyangiaceae bacterium]